MEHWGTKATKPINLSSLVTALNSIPLIGVVREVLRHMTMYRKTVVINNQTGLVGFEPTNAAVKVLCLTAWL